MEDICSWNRWIKGDGGSASESWETWFREENAYFYTLNLTSKGLVMLKGGIYIIVGIALLTAGNPYHSFTSHHAWLPVVVIFFVSTEEGFQHVHHARI